MPGSLLLFLVFPIGLVKLLGLEPPDLMPNFWSSPKPGDSMSGPVFGIACVVYIMLTLSLLLVPQRRAFMPLYFVLVVLLTLNVIGCQEMYVHR